MKDWTEGEQFGAYRPKEVEDIAEIEELEDPEEDTLDLASAAPLAYDALLTLMRPDEIYEPRKKKRKTRKTDASFTEPDGHEEADDSDGDDQVKEDDSVSGELDEEAEADDQEYNATDPFESHFNAQDMIDLQKSCDQVQTNQWLSTTRMVTNGREIYQHLHSRNLDATPIDMTNIDSWHLKQRLHSAVASKKIVSEDDTLLQSFMQNLYVYKDISYAAATYKQVPKLRSLYIIHALNHVFKTRDRILKNNAKLSAHPDSEVEYRDQGFTRPKVLILLPTRHACLQVVDELVALSGAEQVENRKRFSEQFGTEGIDPLKNANKPEDFKARFAGNTDDAFRIGIKFTRKTVKLFAQFYGSDIIIASPLGLRMAIGDVGAKKRDWDYLSSIEMAIVDGADTMAMQNWEHVDYCFEYVNNIPKESHGCDYGRVRNWVLEEKSKFLRQTILVSDYEFPELRSMFGRLQNIDGKLRLKAKADGSILDIGISIRQTFTRFECEDPSRDPDARFGFFKTSTLPRLRKAAQDGGHAGNGCVLFVPSYFDFVRVRNYLTSLEMAFEAVSEYSTTSDLTRSRHVFASGRSSILMMTERLHHYRRYEIKGTKNIFFYQLPEHANYFAEIVRSAAAPGQGKAEGQVRIAFSKWDEGRLERVVGTKRVGKLLTSKDSAFEFS